MQIYTARNTYERMMAYARLCNEEIGMMGTAKMINGNMVITGIYISKQKVHGATCELDPADLARLDSIVMPKNEGDLIVWCHSHVNMGVSPSSQDNETFNRLINQAGRCIAIIVNKKREISARFGHSGIDLIPAHSESVTITVVDQPDFTDDEIKAEIAQYVSKITYNHTYKGNPNLVKSGNAPSKYVSSWNGVHLKGKYWFENDFKNNCMYMVKRDGRKYVDVTVDDYATDHPKCPFIGQLRQRFNMDAPDEPEADGNKAGDDIDPEWAEVLEELDTFENLSCQLWWEDNYKQTFGLKSTDDVSEDTIEDYYNLCKDKNDFTYNGWINSLGSM